MFKKKPPNKPRPTKPAAEASAVTVKYQRPKVLLVDMAEDVATVLGKAGYNVLKGTFGAPYRVQKKSSYLPVIARAELPQYTEQELVVVDLLQNDVAESPIGEKSAPLEELDWWAKCDAGVIDPRPRVMVAVQDKLDRILSTGGVFVLFADSRREQELVWATASEYHGLSINKELHYDNWSLLSLLSGLRIADDHGEEITASVGDSPLFRLVRSHVADASFCCTFEPSWSTVENRWLVLAKNKFGAAVAGLVAPSDNSTEGWIIILPRISDKAGFLLALLRDVLPDLAPSLFPEAEGRWISRTEYELQSILDKSRAISKIRDEAALRVVALEKEIQAERTANQFLYDLLRETGEKLVDAVKVALAELGFSNVVDVDRERDKESKSRREDLQILDQSPTLIVDVKGVGGFPSDDEALQAEKHAAIRMREWKRTDVVGLSIVNHQRNLPPLDRDNTMPFRQELIDAANERTLGLLTSWDLYRLVRNSRKLRWRAEDVRPVFYRTGRIQAVPKHYQFIGVVAKAWTEKFGVVIAEGELRIGDKVALELPVEFEEVLVESMRVNDKNVTVAVVGDPAGILWPAELPKIREGVRVFRIAMGAA